MTNKLYTAYFENYSQKTSEITLRNITAKKGERINQVKTFKVEQVKNLPLNLQENDEITFYSDSDLKEIEITHVNFMEVSND